MKNEDRIVELLSEMLRKQDRQSAQFEKQANQIDRLIDIAEQQTEILVKYDQRFEKLENHLESLELEEKNVSFYLSKVFDVQR
ncbi:MAG: hypothetical protein AAF944_25820 [Bacteroidota bacterium]